ncbi:MAG: coenzyme F420-0:L-glutamate ligase [Treponema sp.]
MHKSVGVVARGLIAPIINNGDDITSIAVDTLLQSSKNENFNIQDGDILGITESVVARSQGNYATFENIAKDIKNKFGNEKIGILFPILSRNRFAPCLEGFAKSLNEIVLLLSYPFDEVGNQLIDDSILEEAEINPLIDSFYMEEFRKRFGSYKHKFTGIDYLEYYDSILKKYNKNSRIILSNNPKSILKETSSCLVCDIHSRKKTKTILKKAGTNKIFGMDEVLSTPIDGSGYNQEYGLLGSNKANEEKVKLFPRDTISIVEKIQKLILEKTGKNIEVLVYGDGAFRDPIGKIWELADPVVSPAFTKGLIGVPNEVKLKYLADNDFSGLPKEEQEKKIAEYIVNHQKEHISNMGEMACEGTTPRNITDLIGSLCDLTSGSGDKGTPFVYIQNYFNKWSS